ncbi:MAG: LamG-like jellyroll fold domain-containing protein [Candidatus Aenigmatarchaeota archaeon]
MRGVSVIIATVLVLMISASLVTLGYTFFTEISDEATDVARKTTEKRFSAIGADMVVESVSGRNIYVRNTGRTNLTAFSVYVNELPVSFSIDKETLQPGETATITLNADPVGLIEVYSAQGGPADYYIPGPGVCGDSILDILEDCDPPGSDSSECSCSGIDGCNGDDYYDYPPFGDCTALCECDTGPGSGEPCEPTITYDDPGCLGPCDIDGTACDTGSQCCNGMCVEGICGPCVSGTNCGERCSDGSYDFDDIINPHTCEGSTNDACNVLLGVGEGDCDCDANCQQPGLICDEIPGTDYCVVSGGGGLIGFWNFDGNTLDSSGNGNDGTNNGASWVSGISGQALDFNNLEGDYVNVDDSPSLDVDYITLSTWIYVNQYLNDQRIVSREYGTTEPYNIYSLILSGTGERKLQFRIARDGQATRDIITSDADIPLNTWTHVAATYDGSTAVVYINGDPNKTILGLPGTIIDSDRPVLIGSSEFYTPRFFDGIIDEVEIWDRALTPAEIQAEYQQYAPSGLIGFWGLDGDATDSTPNNNDGTEVNIDSSDWKTGADCVSGGCLELNGVDEYINIPSIVPDPSQGTFEAWFKPNNLHAGMILYVGQSGGNGLGGEQELHINAWSSGAVNGYYGGGVLLELEAGSYNVGGWNHIAYTYNNNGACELYLNGAPIGSGTLSGTVQTNLWEVSTKIGRPSANERYFNGLLDEVKVWNRVLTPAEVQQEYIDNVPSMGGEIGFWKFDDGSGTIATDSSGNGDDGTLRNMEAGDWKSGADCVSGGCLEFDGVNEYVEADVSGFDYMNGTLAMLIKPAVDSNQFSNQARFYGDSSGRFKFFINGVEDKLYFDNNGILCGTLQLSSSILGWSKDEWHHVAVVWGEPENTISKLYIDGIDVTNYVETGLCGDTQTSNHSIGSNFGGAYPFNGTIDEVKIWNRKLTPVEIQQENQTYDTGGPGGLGTVGFWKFDEGFARDDDNERDDYATGDSWDDGVNKWLVVDTNDIQGQYASLYVYGRVTQCNSTASSDYRIRVNDVVAQTLNINWCDIFGLDTGSSFQSSGWDWVRFEIPKSWLINGENKFNFWDTGGACSWACADWQIGVDLDNYYTRSGWCCNCGLGSDPPKGNTGTCGATSNGELMMYLLNDNKALDSSGNSNDGNLGNGVSGDDNVPQFIVGMSGNALDFDRINDYVRVDDDDTLDMTDELTIAAWIYPRSFGENDYGRIVDKNFYGAYSLYVRLSNPNGFAIGISGSSRTSFGNVITLNTWQHVAVTFNRSAPGNTIIFYVNGNPAGAGTYTNPIPITTDDLYIGNSAALDRTFDGFIDKVKIWDRALTQAEIQADMS